MEELLRNWRAIRSIAGDEGAVWIEKARRFYIWTFIGLVVSIVIALAVAVGCNFAGVKGAAFIIVVPFLVAWVFLQFYPAFILTLLGVGALDGLPKDWSLNRLIKEQTLPDLSLSAMARSGFEFIGKVVRYGAQAALFAIVTSVVLGSWDLANPKTVLPILVILAGFGILAVLYPPGKPWYRWIVTGILLAALAQQLWDAYVPVKEQKEAGAALRNTGTAVKDATTGLLGSGEKTTGKSSSSPGSVRPSTPCQGSVVLEAVYTPSESKGPKVIGKLGPGKYGVSAVGNRDQLFYTRNLTGTYSVQMDANGVMPTRGNAVWKAGNMNPETPQPFVGEAYGAFVIRTNGQPHLIGGLGEFTLNQETRIEGDINVFSHSDVYTGPGSLNITIARCN